MRKLRFKNRNSILYFGVGDTFRSSKLKDTNVNRNIIKGKFKRGELDAELGIGISKNIPTVAALTQQAINEKSKSLKLRTIKSYISIRENQIIPFFGERLITEITAKDINNYHNFLVDRKVSKAMVITARVILSRAFESAVINGIMYSNPVKLVSAPKRKVLSNKKKQKPLSLDEIEKVLSEARGSVRNFLGISIFTGMRSGELLALTWDDVDFDSETITIDKTLSAGMIEDSPKTRSSERDIEMADRAKEYFLAQRRETGLQNTYLFLNGKGEHHSNHNVFYNGFHDILDSLGLERRSPHNTRHTFASIMLNNEIDIMWVSHMLGHESVAITLSMYAHYMPRKEKMSLPFLEKKRYKNGTS